MGNKTVNTLICDWIYENGCRHVFLVPGSQIDPLGVCIVGHPELTPVVACNELGAAFMADGYSRVMNGPGVCASTGGPGALYMLPGAIIARTDGIPVLYLTGDVPSWLDNSSAFQGPGHYATRCRELYDTGIDNSQLLSNDFELEKVFTAISQRLNFNKPAHLTIPVDVQQKFTNETLRAPCDQRTSGFDEVSVRTVAAELRQSSFPIMLVGTRMVGHEQAQALYQFVESLQIPVATTYGAKGILPENHPLSLGNFGYAGTQRANSTLLEGDCDLLLVLGSNLGQRETYNWDQRLLRTRLLRVDVAESASSPIVPDLDLHVRDLGQFLCELKKRGPFVFNKRTFRQQSNEEPIHRLELLVNTLSGLAPADTMLFVDSGSHRLAVGRKWKALSPCSFFSSDTLAPMGWAISAAIGAKFARPQSPTVVVTGDGCMRMGGMEIATAVRYKLPIVFIIANNMSYQSITSRMPTPQALSELAMLPVIDWVEYARSLGAQGVVLEDLCSAEKILQEALTTDGPFIIDFRIGSRETVTPSLPLWPPQEGYNQ